MEYWATRQNGRGVVQVFWRNNCNGDAKISRFNDMDTEEQYENLRYGFVQCIDLDHS